MKKIPLTQGKFALIDDEDFALVSQYKWFYRKSGRTNGNNGYAQHSIFNKEKYLIAKKEGHYRYNDSIFMHNLILSPKIGFEIDHKDRNGLNNQRNNLRLVTHSQNMNNFPKKGKNKYRGVCFHKWLKIKPWEAYITINYKRLSLGCFATPEEAAKIRDKKSIELYGDYSQLNFTIK